MLLFGCSEGVVSLQTISIRTKLVIAFSILTVFAIGLGVLGLVSSYKLREQSLQIENNWLPSIRILGEIDTLTARSSGLLLRHTQATDAILLASIERDMDSFDKKLLASHCEGEGKDDPGIKKVQADYIESWVKPARAFMAR